MYTLKLNIKCGRMSKHFAFPLLTLSVSQKLKHENCSPPLFKVLLRKL